MGPEIYFTALVFAIGALDIVWRAASAISKKMDLGQSTQGTAKKVIRDDWYMFFHRSALLGPLADETEETGSTSSRKSTPVTKPKRKDRRTPARLNVS